jgi:glycosyltransferase involved in cell wall biosynthesis
MRILISTYAFAPSVGGLEEVTELLAREFAARGHEVRVVTMTEASGRDEFPFEVLRRPSPRRLLRAVRWCDVYLQQNVGLRLGWPLLLVPRPWVVALHGPLGERGGWEGLKRRIKALVIRLARRRLAVSAAVAREVGGDVEVIANPYRDTRFRRLKSGERSTDLVFLGRLVSDKGAALLLEAMALLRGRGLRPTLLIVGGGPEESALRARRAELELGGQVRFAGVVREEMLVELLNGCRIMVVPSLWEEPFGIVALEGIACGCVVAAARAGGLPEAIGPCGVTFPKGDAAALADSLAGLLGDPSAIARLQAAAPEHLRRHRPSAAADAYLRVLESVRA